jgi:hypothetical protein
VAFAACDFLVHHLVLHVVSPKIVTDGVVVSRPLSIVLKDAFQLHPPAGVHRKPSHAVGGLDGDREDSVNTEGRLYCYLGFSLWAEIGEALVDEP